MIPNGMILLGMQQKAIILIGILPAGIIGIDIGTNRIGGQIEAAD